MALPDKPKGLPRSGAHQQALSTQVRPQVRPGRPAAAPVRSHAQKKHMVVSVGAASFVLLVVFSAIGLYWDQEPELFDVRKTAVAYAGVNSTDQLTIGYTYSATLLKIADTLLDKPGGYIYNDIFPPGILIDDIQNWEKGALLALRDAMTVLRNQFSRSQSQSKENRHLAVAEPHFYYRMESWALPDSESEYRRGAEALRKYMDGLQAKAPDAQFFDNADNLRIYMETVLKRLGDFSLRLSASAEHYPQRTRGDGQPRRVGPQAASWFAIDDAFFEARGYSWALTHIVKAVLIDCSDTIEVRNIGEQLRQITLNLDEGLEPILVPIVLNGSGYGIFANYSLTLANYLSRASGAAVDVRNLLLRG